MSAQGVKKNAVAARVILLAGLVVSLVSTGFTQTKNGFDLSNSTIPLNKILSGGPPRDAIPSINHPKFIPASKVGYLKDDDIVIGLVHKGRARAYPQRILIWHEIVNDTIEGVPIAITYCPLCGTSLVFSREIEGVIRTLGVSGLLYQSDVLMYDWESESLFSQLAMKAVTGPLVGTPLEWLPSEHMTWGAWRKKYPDGEVLSRKTGFQRNYMANAYDSYFASDRTMFPVPHHRKELKNKEWIIGVVINGQAKAYPAKALPDRELFEDTVGGEKIMIIYDAKKRHPLIKGGDDKPVPSVMAFWFAWQAFYPQTELWDAESSSGSDRQT